MLTNPATISDTCEKLLPDGRSGGYGFEISGSIGASVVMAATEIGSAVSGPKIIDYRAIERERAEAARRRWRSLRGRSDALARRCQSSGHPECIVSVAELDATTGEQIEAECDRLERALAHAVGELSRAQLRDRSEQVRAGMQDVLADLERRERAAAMGPDTTETTMRRAETPRPDYTRRVADQLAALRIADAEIEEEARRVLATSDPARARLLYTDLAHRVDEANRRTDRLTDRRTEIAEVRAQLEAVTDPVPIRAVLDQATTVAEQDGDITALLRQARDALTTQLDAAAARSDRAFVRKAVAESLTELGYDVVDVEVQTPESLVLRQSRTHAVQAQVADGEIDLRAVRLDSEPERDADRSAEEEFCRRLPGFLDAMARRGIVTGIKKQGLPGLYAPQVVRLRGGETESQSSRQRPPVAHKRSTGA